MIVISSLESQKGVKKVEIVEGIWKEVKKLKNS